MAISIPYFTLPSIPIYGQIGIHPFGILVATGVFVGAKLVHRWSERKGLEETHVRGAIFWAVAAGFVGAHVFDVLAYQSDKLRQDPLLLIKIWAGISSYGGFLGGTLGVIFYTLKHKLSLRAYADALIWGLVPGFTFGRLGCTIVHDHVGRPAGDFFLATYYPNDVVSKYGLGAPGPHHNLGMYEFLFMLLLCGLMWAVARKPRQPGFMVGVVVATYAPVRFVLDFLRLNQTDPRYLGLTFAQWMSVLAAATGILLLIRLRGAPSESAPQAVANGDNSGPTKALDKAASGKSANKSRKRRKKK